jgi:hypothetical protein
VNGTVATLLSVYQRPLRPQQVFSPRFFGKTVSIESLATPCFGPIGHGLAAGRTVCPERTRSNGGRAGAGGRHIVGRRINRASSDRLRARVRSRSPRGFADRYHANDEARDLPRRDEIDPNRFDAGEVVLLSMMTLVESLDASSALERRFLAVALGISLFLFLTVGLGYCRTAIRRYWKRVPTFVEAIRWLVTRRAPIDRRRPVGPREAPPVGPLNVTTVCRAGPSP